MMESLWTLGLIAMVSANPTPNKEVVNTQNYKDQYCTDPRTMRKHAAYTEWADAYSCTRHRCQPGGRNLAIYTVGCKRVEAPESAIECEEVVEDTNMQFPFCCTRLRCLVVVRGEVWTRVLGQPWEVLPAAPWSHMYKMKKPPPSDTTFQPKLAEQGPIYELAEPESEGSKAENLRSARKQNPTENPDCNEVVPRAAPSAPGPDIVIALSTNNDKEPFNKKSETRRSDSVEKLGLSWPNQAHSDSDSDTEHKRVRKTTESHLYDKEEEREQHHEPAHDDVQEAEEPVLPMDKTQNIHHQPWTEAPQTQWNDHETEGHDADGRVQIMELRYTQEPTFHRPELSAEGEKNERREEKRDKPNNLQALVDAIGTRMKDIENVVQKMSEKVHQTKIPGRKTFSKYAGKTSAEATYNTPRKPAVKEEVKPKHEQERTEHVRPPPASDDHYRHALKVANMTRLPSARRLMPALGIEPNDSLALDLPSDHDKELEFEGNSISVVRTFRLSCPPAKSHNSKYLHGGGGSGVADTTQDSPLYIEDNGNFFSDASNSVRRSNAVPKEPSQSPPTYMAPVANHHNPSKTAMVSEEDPDRKKKKHSHKKRRSKTHTHKKHHNQDKRKHFNKVGSTELDKNAMSTEDSSAK